jgi:CRP-like cAMP-binding protein
VISDLNYSLEYYLRQNNIQLAFPSQSFVLPSSDSSIPYEGNNSHSSKNIAVKDLIREIDYFSDLNELEVRQLIEIGYHRQLNSQEILFNEGDEGDAFYIVLDGQVEIFVPIINKQLVILDNGAFFGELALLLGIPRTASVKALTPTTLFAIDKIGFQQLLQRHPEMGQVIINSLGKHQDELKKRQDQLREMGLIDDEEDDTNPVIWMRQRLERLFFKKSA